MRHWMKKMCVPLNGKDVTNYRGIVGSTNWVSLLRMDCKFYQHVVAGRMQNPRVWDMYCAVWYLEYLSYTDEYPLVLGGPIVDPQSMSDASFATLSEKRSVKSHMVRTGPLSGAIMAKTGTIKCALTSVWEAEVEAACDGIDSLMYVMNVCDELCYQTLNNREHFIDSESGVEWFETGKLNERSRHVQTKFYHTKHSVQEGLVTAKFIDGQHNEIDIGTKVLSARRTKELARKILGHYLVLGQGYRGVIEFDDND
jgi:hypothetical protein